MKAFYPLGMLLLMTANAKKAHQVDLPEWMVEMGEKLQHTKHITPSTFVRVREKLVSDILEWGKTLSDLENKLEYPYFAFLPNLVGNIPVDGSSAVNVSAPCFSHTSFEFDDAANRIIITASQPQSHSCSDFYLLATTSTFHLEHITSRGVHKIDWKVPADWTPAEQWDQETKGIRILRFTTNVLETFHSLVQTAALFEPIIAQSADVSKRAAQRNVEFLKKYAGFEFLPRGVEENKELGEEEVGSGDLFGVIRMDGLDPMLSWGMGATTGHMTTALWMEGELYVCESQIKSSYWPQDNVQRTPFKQWLTWANEAGYNVIHVPLSDAARASYNETAALQFFESVEGIAYGYHNLLWGWVDTLKDNYPCLPPSYDRCLEWSFLEVGFALFDRHIPAISNLLWSEAFNLRIGTEGLSTSEVYQAAAAQGISSQQIPSIVEQDTWLYHTTRYNKSNEVMGPSMVCCVFVCSMWKAAGVFGDMAEEINCGELTNADDVLLQIFRGDFAQIAGKWTMFVPGFNTRTPYAHMDETCPSLAPSYDRPSNC